MNPINIQEVKSHLLPLAPQPVNGEHFMITRPRKPLVKPALAGL